MENYNMNIASLSTGFQKRIPQSNYLIKSPNLNHRYVNNNNEFSNHQRVFNAFTNNFQNSNSKRNYYINNNNNINPSRTQYGSFKVNNYRNSSLGKNTIRDNYNQYSLKVLKNINDNNERENRNIMIKNNNNYNKNSYWFLEIINIK